MESVGESAWSPICRMPAVSRRIVASESASESSYGHLSHSGPTESVSESSSWPETFPSYTATAKKISSSDSLRIRQLKKELADLQEELELSKQINDVKEKIKKYRK